MHFLVLLTKLLAFQLVFDVVVRRSDLLPRSEDSFEGQLILLLGSLKESVTSFNRRRERFWLW